MFPNWIVCVAAPAERSARRGAKGDAGTSAECRNEAGAHRRRNLQGRGLCRRGGVAGLARSPRYALRPSPTRRRQIPPAQATLFGNIRL